MRRIMIPLSGITLTAFASAPATAEYASDGPDFSLQVEHNETRWQYADRTLTSKSSILGIRLQETLAPRLRGSLHAGYLELSQPENPLPAAQFTSGGYGGVQLSLLLLETSRLTMTLSGGYTYLETDGEGNNTRVELAWHDTYAQLGTSLALTERLTLHAAGGISRTSGEQRVSGDTEGLLTFDEQQRGYYAAGLAYWMDGTGYLSATWLGGSRDGFRFSFHRRF